MSVDNDDNDEGDSHTMEFVKSAIHKNVDNMLSAQRAPFNNGLPPSFSSRKSAAPTCVIIMSCRWWRRDDESDSREATQARTQLRQTSLDVQGDNQNILWDTNGPQQSSDDTACIQRLCDKQQILTLDAHGETVTQASPGGDDYVLNRSNIFWVFPAVTGLSLTSSQYSKSLKALDLLWKGKIKRENGRGTYDGGEAWLDFLMGPQDPMENEVKRALQKITYPYSPRTGDRTLATLDPGVDSTTLEASLLSWRVYRPGDLMPRQSYSFWTEYSTGKFFRSGINTLSNVLLTNRAMSAITNTRTDGDGALLEPSILGSFWEIFERQQMKLVDGVNTLPLVPEVTFNGPNKSVDSINFKLYHRSGLSRLHLENIPHERRDAHYIEPQLHGNHNGLEGWILNGHTNMNYFTGLCLPSLIDKIPVINTTGIGGDRLVAIMQDLGYNIWIQPGKKPSRSEVEHFRTETGDRWRERLGLGDGTTGETKATAPSDSRQILPERFQGFYPGTSFGNIQLEANNGTYLGQRNAMVFEHGRQTRGGYELSGTFYNYREERSGSFELTFDNRGSFDGRWKWNSDYGWKENPWTGSRDGGRDLPKLPERFQGSYPGTSFGDIELGANNGTYLGQRNAMVFEHGRQTRGGYELSGTFYNYREERSGSFELTFDNRGSFDGRWKWNSDYGWKENPWTGSRGGGTGALRGGRRKTRRKKNERRRKTRTKNKRRKKKTHRRKNKRKRKTRR